MGTVYHGTSFATTSSAFVSATVPSPPPPPPPPPPKFRQGERVVVQYGGLYNFTKEGSEGVVIKCTNNTAKVLFDKITGSSYEVSSPRTYAIRAQDLRLVRPSTPQELAELQKLEAPRKAEQERLDREYRERAKREEEARQERKRKLEQLLKSPVEIKRVQMIKEYLQRHASPPYYPSGERVKITHPELIYSTKDGRIDSKMYGYEFRIQVKSKIKVGTQGTCVFAFSLDLLSVRDYVVAVKFDGQEGVTVLSFVGLERISTLVQDNRMEDEKTMWFSIDAHNTLMQIRKEYGDARQKGDYSERYIRAIPVMLGKNNDGVITHIIEMRPRGGCEMMPSVGPSELSRAMIEIGQKGLVPCGIGRIGTAFLKEKSGQQIYGSYDLTRFGQGGIMLSVSRDGITIQKYVGGPSPVINYEYGIKDIKRRRIGRTKKEEAIQKMEGGEIDGKEN